jgi:hypothetical protein
LGGQWQIECLQLADYWSAKWGFDGGSFPDFYLEVMAQANRAGIERIQLLCFFVHPQL